MCERVFRLFTCSSEIMTPHTHTHGTRCDNMNLFLSPRLQLSFIYVSPRCWCDRLIRGAVKLIYFLAAGRRQLGSKSLQQSGPYNCSVIIFTQLLGGSSDGARRFRLTCYSNKAAINKPLTSKHEGQVIRLSSRVI